jgi:hypothetical protein
MNTPQKNDNRWIIILAVVVVAILVTCVLPSFVGFGVTFIQSLDVSPEINALLGVATFLVSCFPFLLIPGLFIGYFVYRHLNRARFGKPEVTVPQTLRVGDLLPVQYRHTFNRDVTCDLFSVQLIFEERATYSQGSSTRTVAHEQVLAETALANRTFQAGEMIADTLQGQIPYGAMHTLKAPRNVLRWLVRLKFVIPKAPDYVDEYEITVLPELVR